jgi:hypothetical protein
VQTTSTAFVCCVGLALVSCAGARSPAIATPAAETHSSDHGVERYCLPELLPRGTGLPDGLVEAALLCEGAGDVCPTVPYIMVTTEQNHHYSLERVSKRTVYARAGGGRVVVLSSDEAADSLDRKLEIPVIELKIGQAGADRFRGSLLGRPVGRARDCSFLLCGELRFFLERVEDKWVCRPDVEGASS